MHYLHFYVPKSHLDSVKAALFAQGAGRIGNYEHCAWQVLGVGQFRPLKNSKPFLGESGKLAKIAEYKVEMVCEDDCVAAVIAALQNAHPYEQPAYVIFKVS
ncbi:MAG TPA: NGG1p interacting factor NIF3 [Gammaproteobacteria bacterium]|nr:NGG1p interacting factor NIF3 [Gammaproteobacteria bacterium]